MSHLNAMVISINPSSFAIPQKRNASGRIREKSRLSSGYNVSVDCHVFYQMELRVADDAEALMRGEDRDSYGSVAMGAVAGIAHGMERRCGSSSVDSPHAFEDL